MTSIPEKKKNTGDIIEKMKDGVVPIFRSEWRKEKLESWKNFLHRTMSIIMTPNEMANQHKNHVPGIRQKKMPMFAHNTREKKGKIWLPLTIDWVAKHNKRHRKETGWKIRSDRKFGLWSGRMRLIAENESNTSILTGAMRCLAITQTASRW